MFPVSQVGGDARILRDWLIEVGIRVEICGGLRRGNDEVGGITILTNMDVAMAARVLRYQSDAVGISFSLNTGCKKRCGGLFGGTPIHLASSTDGCWGAALIFFTGSQLFNKVIRTRAKEQGLKLNQYGLFCGVEVIASKTEEQIFSALGLPFIPPNKREKGSFKL